MKRKAHKGGRKRRQAGGNIFKSIGNAFKSAGEAVFNKVIKPGFKAVKDQKLISKGLNLIPHPYAKAGATVADHLGFGKRKRRGQAGGAKRKPRARVINI